MLDRFVDAGGRSSTPPTPTGRRLRARPRAVARAAPRRRRARDEGALRDRRPAGQGLSPDRIRAACDASLKRLGTDVIDLYQVHAPDPTVPLEETLEALDGLVRAGKVRALGASNYPAWLLAGRSRSRTATAGRRSSRSRRSTRSSSARSRSRRSRSAVPPASACCPGVRSARGSSAAATAATRRCPKAAGWRPPPRPRGGAARRAIERNFRVIDAAEAIAADRGITVPQVAIAWLQGSGAWPRRSSARARWRTSTTCSARPISPDRRRAREPRGAGAAAGPLPAPDAHRAGRARRRDRAVARP